MIELERRELLRFRAAVRRCVVSRPRGMAPSVILQQSKDDLTLSAVLEETALALRLSLARGPVERLAVPFASLAALDGPGSGIVAFEAEAGGALRCRLTDRGETTDIECEAVPPDQQPPELPRVGKLQPVDPTFIAALHACGQSASRKRDGRFAMDRLQLRGRAGEVAATDGHQLLLWGGFELPFPDNLLVPAVPLFGSRELAAEQEVAVGRDDKYFVLAVGPWMVWLRIDAASRFPDVASVLPKASRMGRLVLDEADATALLRYLEDRPTSEEEIVPLVLEFAAKPMAHWHEGKSRQPLNLGGSTCTGPATAAPLDPKFLACALSLGFREVRGSANSPVLFRDPKRSYVVMTYGAATATVPVDPSALPAPRSVVPLPQNGDATVTAHNGGARPDQPSTDDVLDPLVEAEGLRAALAEAARRLTRLISSLRHLQKQRRALQSAWDGLRHFGLRHKEET